ncbi:MAG TPA: macro domain-containing protein [Thermoleophilaceae bacterium]
MEPLGLFFPDRFEWGWGGYAALVGVGALVAVMKTWPRDSISQSLPPDNVRVEIRVGDVLKQRGNVIVGACDTFDTALEQQIIARNSVQGQLLTEVFEGDRDRLDTEIAAFLPPNGQVDDAKTFGKKVRYPIGTVAMVKSGDTRFFLPAFTRMSSDRPPRVESSIPELHLALAETWAAIDAAGQREPIHTPIIGSNLGRIKLTKTLLIQMIVLSFVGSSRRGPELVVHVTPKDAEDVDMAMLEGWLRALCAA